MITSDIVVAVENVTKMYKLYEKNTDRLLEALHPLKKKYHKEFYAVKNVSFQIRKGEIVGIIGKNGSGKSTLLKMITGILSPTAGKVTVDGKVSALLELGAGFNPEMTGIENVYLNGTIMGFSRKEIDDRLETILSFADIGEFAQQPVKSYSSGMFVRLAFAVAINVNPDILIVDEALSVGDIRFQQKCYRKLEEFKRDKTIVMVSHDQNAIANYCDRAIWINEGEIVADGEPVEVSKQYQAYMIDSSLIKSQHLLEATKQSDTATARAIEELPQNLDVLGDGKVGIRGIGMIDSSGRSTTIVSPNQEVSIIIKVKANEQIENPIVGLTIKERLGNIIGQTNSHVLGVNLPPLVPNREDTYCFRMKLPSLNNGQYTISPAVASGSQEDHIQHCWVHDAIIFNVIVPGNQLEGYLLLDNVEFQQNF